jgi:Domain of unknown function (DUF4160)
MIRVKSAENLGDSRCFMDLTPYHAKYFAYELTKRCPSDSVEKFAGALVDAQVDLNPHQVEAALFAFRSPLSKGLNSPHFHARYGEHKVEIAIDGLSVLVGRLPPRVLGW